MGWQFWLAAPLVVTLCAAVVIWWQARPRSTPSVHVRVRDHHRFLDELGRHSGPAGAVPASVVLAPVSPESVSPESALIESDAPSTVPVDAAPPAVAQA